MSQFDHRITTVHGILNSPNNHTGGLWRRWYGILSTLTKLWPVALTTRKPLILMIARRERCVFSVKNNHAERRPYAIVATERCAGTLMITGNPRSCYISVGITTRTWRRRKASHQIQPSWPVEVRGIQGHENILMALPRARDILKLTRNPS